MAARAKRRPVKARSDVASQVTPAKDKNLIELARKRFAQAETAETNQREREIADLQFYAGEQWPLDVLNSRQGQPGNQANGVPPVPARPSLTINKTRKPVHQITNQMEQSELGVEIVAEDDFGDGTPGVTKEEIELREGLVRRIQRQSQAQNARLWAGQRAVQAGRGFWRVMTKYVSGKTFDQELSVDRIYNQSSVLLDPAHEEPDGSDADWGFIGSDVPWDRYKAEYGQLPNSRKNPLLSASAQEWRALGDELPGWFSLDADTRSVRVVEYWRIVRESVEIVQLESGAVVNAADLKPSDVVATDPDTGEEMRRSEVQKTVKWAKIDGVQVLDETDWVGKYIPLIKVVGEELQPYDNERRSEGVVRPMRDSATGFNVMVSKFVEVIGLAPMASLMLAEGQDEGFEAEYQLSNTRMISPLHYRQVDLEGRAAPPPFRPPTATAESVSAIGAAVQMFDQAVTSTSETPDVAYGNIDPGLKRAGAKGIAQAISQAQQGTSHYLSNWQKSIRYEGIIVNDLLYAIYGRKGRLARLMQPSGETKSIPLHVPFVAHPKTGALVTQGVTPQTEGAKTYTLTPDATFNVTVKVTKNEETRRQQQESTLIEVVGADPQLMGVYGDLVWKYNDGPGHEELEERAEAVLIPPVQAMLQAKKGTGPSVAQLQTQIAQLTQQNAELKQKADPNSTKLAISAHGDALEWQVQQLQAQTKIVVADIMTKNAAAIADMKAQIDVYAKVAGLVQQERLAEKAHMADAAHKLHDSAHELAIGAAEHVRAQELSNQQHQQNLEAGAVSHDQQMESQTTPPPVDPNTQTGADNASQE